MVAIRPIRADEGPALRAIRLRALAESPSAFGSTLAETETRPLQYWIDRAASNAAGEESIMFAAEDGSRWVGLIGGYLLTEDGSSFVELISMWVDPAYRGQGLGRQLVERLVEWARERGVATVALWVTATNEAAIALYRRCGFTSTGETQPHPRGEGLREARMVLAVRVRHLPR